MNLTAIRQLSRWGTALLLATVVPRCMAGPTTLEYSEYANFNHGDSDPKDKGIEWVQAIKVSSPLPGTNLKGEVTVNFVAPGMTKAKASCWHQPTTDNPSAWGHDVDVAPDISLSADGSGSFIFPADQFPNGPLTLRIYAKDAGKKQDVFQLQLFNEGGVSWNQGIPKSDPPAAEGMSLLFADDFDHPLSISTDGKGATYMSHKTGGGDFSGYVFSDNAGDNNPFSQVGTFLRIHASKKPGAAKGSTGIISSARQDHTGIFASAPCYFECRFIAQSAPGTWPAFWLLNKGCLDKSTHGSDELDIVEAYGGQGKKNPNFPGYAATTHYWGQKGPDGKQRKAGHADAPVMDIGGKSSWSTTFHTYAVKITKTDTIYYFDDIEILRHPTGEISKTDPFWFMVNYAIGGISGWHTDLERYGNVSDMYVDYVRVYQGPH
jgi:hypothetical protein